MSILIPILNNWNPDEIIGTLSIDEKYLPKHHNFVFSIGFSRQKDGNRSYKLHEVSIVLDENFIAYLNKMKNLETKYPGFKDIPIENEA